jgi:alanyl-tRNA synthetase
MQVRPLLLEEIGRSHHLRRLQVTPPSFSCRGKYTFIGKGCGIGL